MYSVYSQLKLYGQLSNSSRQSLDDGGHSPSTINHVIHKIIDIIFVYWNWMHIECVIASKQTHLKLIVIVIRGLPMNEGPQTWDSGVSVEKWVGSKKCGENEGWPE